MNWHQPCEKKNVKKQALPKAHSQALFETLYRRKGAQRAVTFLTERGNFPQNRKIPSPENPLTMKIPPRKNLPLGKFLIKILPQENPSLENSFLGKFTPGKLPPQENFAPRKIPPGKIAHVKFPTRKIPLGNFSPAQSHLLVFFYEK